KAVDVVLKSLASENANNDCKKALDMIHNHVNVELSDYIKVCANIDSEQFKVELIATAIVQQLQVSIATIKCFECREKHCPKGEKDNKKPNKPSPHCQKGFHWSNQCWPEYDKDRNSLPNQGNSKRGMQSSTPQSNGTTLNQTPI
ncbi:GAK6 protein, partial [Thryothorus ludovicianus]|nr:GAK6 protein [Thryothorus ludovicianus]